MAEDIELLVDNWIKTAHERGASDIHLEPESDDKMRVRIRVDGALRTLETVAQGRKVMARIKVMASLDVNERAVPLDGRISFPGAGRHGLDLRLATLPSLHGEKAVLRLIDNSKLKLGVEEIGLSKRMLAAYQPLLKSPNGLILHVGPTGSGKTTSLYAAMQTVNQNEVNIQTVEDPIEYTVLGVTQTQVSHDLGLTFPRVLRALLRQDPNVILVGEIRDVETAEIAIEAALTGHIVLSTLHSNDAIGTVIRLLDMGVPPYCIAYALRCVVSQRLVRKLCSHCRKAVQPPESIQKLVGGQRPIFQAEGCKDCGRTGYDGRVALFELLPMSPALRRALYASTDPDELAAVAARNGLITLWQDGLEKLLQGVTTLEEVLRVTRQPKDAVLGAARSARAHATPGPSAPRPVAIAAHAQARKRPVAPPAASPSPRPAP